jgi:hypothetical protein
LALFYLNKRKNEAKWSNRTKWLTGALKNFVDLRRVGSRTNQHFP